MSRNICFICGVLYLWLVVFVRIVDARVAQRRPQKTQRRETDEDQVDGPPQHTEVQHGLEVEMRVGDDPQEEQCEDGEEI